ncbi:MAG TPA: hypothetical protein VGZ01_05055, partial [Trinickia sp.]|nr:hypothetical protein [Trinickia sp.]
MSRRSPNDPLDDVSLADFGRRPPRAGAKANGRGKGALDETESEALAGQTAETAQTAQSAQTAQTAQSAQTAQTAQ